MQVDEVTIHHEGAGSPTDNVARFLDTDNYSAGVGITLAVVRRSPADSFVSTEDFEHYFHAFQICLSGNREVHAVTDNDIKLVAQACAKARSNGWLTDNPRVRHHGDNGSSACPGDHANERRGDLWLACQKPLAIPPPAPKPDTIQTGGVLITMSDNVKTKIITTTHRGFNQFTGTFDAGAPVRDVQATIHGPAPTVAVPSSTDDFWAHTIDATVRAQARGNRVIVTVSAPKWKPGQPVPAVHVWALV